MVISIIIPTYNEALVIKKTIEHLQKHLLNKEHEIIISDAGSTDETVQIAEKLRVKTLISPVKGRAGQMNYGVKNALGDVYFFLHADSLPTPLFYNLIATSLSKGFNCAVLEPNSTVLVFY